MWISHAEGTTKAHIAFAADLHRPLIAGRKRVSDALIASGLNVRKDLVDLLLSFAKGSDQRPVKVSPMEPLSMGTRTALRAALAPLGSPRRPF